MFIDFSTIKKNFYAKLRASKQKQTTVNNKIGLLSSYYGVCKRLINESKIV